ncbi:unnamed protein product [Musa acuminata var. zebrina]
MAETAPTTTTSEHEKRGKKDGGLLLGRFEVGKLLGAGTFAKVYVARDVNTNELVAIKALDKEMILKGGLVAHIKREIAILRRVRHPYVVQLFEVMATRSKIYFVMEYVRGGELFSRVSKGRLLEDTARRYFQQLISAVAFCHARGVFHRDLKPENLLVDEYGDLKVSDFGLSAVAEQMRGDGLFHTFCGTPAYVAPEVLSRRGYDGAKVDVWSCGVILFVLMAGYLPFHDRSIVAMYRKIYKGTFRCPRWFSQDLVHLLRRLLDVNPQTRITIPEIMENPWFKKGFRHVRFYIEDNQLHSFDDPADDEVQSNEPKPDETYESGSESDCSVASCPATFSDEQRQPLPRPPSLNAFDIISFSTGFDLSGLFEETGEMTRFLSKEPVSDIVSKLEEIAKVVSFKVRRKDCRISLEGTREGEKGPLTIGVDIYELTPSMVVVEVKKKAGDGEEYEEFCNKELQPGLKHLVYETFLKFCMLIRTVLQEFSLFFFLSISIRHPHVLKLTCRSDGASTSDARRARRRSISFTPEIGDDIVRLVYILVMSGCRFMCLAFDFGVTDHLSGNRGTELPQRRPQRVPLHQKTNSEVNSLHRTAVAAVDRRVKPEKRQSPRSTLHEIQRKSGPRVADLETKLGRALVELDRLRDRLALAEAAKLDAERALEMSKEQVPAASAESINSPNTNDVFQVVAPTEPINQEKDDVSKPEEDETETAKEEEKTEEEQCKRVEIPDSTEMVELKSKLLEKTTEVGILLEENVLFKRRAAEETAKATAAARAKEEELMTKLRSAEEELKQSKAKEELLTEQLQAAEGAKSVLEAEMNLLRVQTEQWRKAAEAAAAALVPGDVGDEEWGPALMAGDGMGEEGVVAGRRRKKGAAGVRMFGELWKKKSLHK